MSRAKHGAKRLAIKASGLCVCLAIIACAPKEGGTRPAALTPQDFASHPEAPSPVAGDAPGSAPEEQPLIERRNSLIDPEVSEVRVVDAAEAGAGLTDVEVLIGPPLAAATAPGGASSIEISASAGGGGPAAASAPAPGGGEGPDVVASYPMDAIVGHINGRALYASQFFEPMDARMRTEAQRMSQAQWLRFAQEQIQRALRDYIRDELLLAELEASLSEQERVGLLAFVGQLRQNILSENRGSAPLADRRLLEEEGITLDEKILQERNRELVRMQLRRAVAGKMTVSWRDVRQAYERDFDRYNPAPLARFRVVWTQANDEAQAAAIAQRLEAGEPFAQIASDRAINSYPAEGGVVEVRLAPGGWEQTRFFQPDALHSAAQSLAPGGIVGPVDFARRRVWMTLEAVEDHTESLYDAQLTIYDDLVADRFMEAQGEYFTTLISRGSLTDIAAMEKRLFEMAAERYLINPDAH